MAVPLQPPNVRQAGAVAYQVPVPRTDQPTQNMGGTPALTLPSLTKPPAQPGVNSAPPGRPSTTPVGAENPRPAPTTGGVTYGVTGSAAQKPTMFGVPAFSLSNPAGFAFMQPPGGGTGAPNQQPAAPQPQQQKGQTPGQGKALAAGKSRGVDYAGRPITAGPVDGWGALKTQGYDAFKDQMTPQQFKDNVRAYRARFQEGGDVWARQEEQDWKIAKWMQARGGRPPTEREFGAFLNSIGIHDRHEEGQARYRSLMMDLNNSIIGNEHFGSGAKFNVATSDTTMNGVAQAITAQDRDYLAKGFWGRLQEKLGIGGMFGKRAGNYPELQQMGDYFVDNDGPEGGVYYNKQGWMVDPNTGQVVGGHYYDPMSKHEQRRFPLMTAGAAPTAPGAPGGPAAAPAAPQTLPAALAAGGGMGGYSLPHPSLQTPNGTTAPSNFTVQGQQPRLSPWGSGGYSTAGAQRRRAYGPRLSANDPRAPQPTQRAGAMFNPVTGRFV